MQIAECVTRKPQQHFHKFLTSGQRSPRGQEARVEPQDDLHGKLFMAETGEESTRATVCKKGVGCTCLNIVIEIVGDTSRFFRYAKPMLIKR